LTKIVIYWKSTKKIFFNGSCNHAKKRKKDLPILHTKNHMAFFLISL